MKFFRKIFLAILVPLIIGTNVAIFYVTNLNYSMMFDNELQATTVAASNITEFIYYDFASFDEWNILSYDNKKHTFSTYAPMCRRNNVYLHYMENGETVFSYGKIKELDIEWDLADETSGASLKGKYVTTEYDGEEYLVIKTNLGIPYEMCDVLYIYPLHDLMLARRNMWMIAFFVEGILILVMGIILFFMIRKMLKPLQSLTVAAKCISAGEYGRKIEITGNDEVALLAEDFNEMSDALEDKIEMLRNSALEKQIFIDNLGHELRTPLTTISGYAEFLQLAQVDETEKMNALGYISSETKRLTKLSDSLLKLALLRISEIEKSEISFSEMKWKLVQGFAVTLANKGIALCVDEREGKMFANEELIYSLIANLVENAARACEEKGHIYVSMEEYNEGACMGLDNGLSEFVRIRVRDDGIGIQSEDIPKIEEPFYRVDKARSCKSGGIGLGMTLCKQIVNCHHGKMSCDSIYGEGTAVTVLIRNY